MRKYTIKKAPGATLKYYHREILQKDWNDRIEHGKMPTLRAFARDHGLAVQTWKREFDRGKTGETVPDPKRPGRMIYALYDAGKAQDKINEGYANKGAPMKVTNKLDAIFAKLVKEMKLSPYDAVCRMKEVIGCNIYYTRAYASYEKGSVENCNRLVRRWYPKGTDFSLCSAGDIRKLEEIINSIHRLALGGKTAAQYDTEFALAA